MTWLGLGKDDVTYMIWVKGGAMCFFGEETYLM